MNVIGIDPSLTNTAVCVLDERGNVVGQKRFASKPAYGLRARIERFNKLAEEVCEYACTHAINHLGWSYVCIEGYAYSRNEVGQADQHEFGGLLRSMLLAKIMSLQPIEVGPTSLKKFVVGKGNAKKSQMMLAVYKRWGVECATDDDADAYGLARMALCLGGYAEPENVQQREAIATVLAPPKISKKRSKAAVDTAACGD